MSLLAAALIDWFLGEPPTRLHPVAWIGNYLSRAGRGLTALPPRRAFLAGATRWLAGAVVFTGVFGAAAWGLAWLPWWADALGTALLLKPLFAFRMLLSEVRAVEAALQETLDAGRRRLAFIVSRDTTQLSTGEVRESALESLSENLSDSVVAPLFWFSLLGLPGAALYRFANTADAMWGYRGAWEWAGKWAARVDDGLNYIPARVTALLIMVCGAALRTTPRSSLQDTSSVEGLPQPAGCGPLRSLLREARETASPNSGWPMAAFALRLGIRLGKPGVYVLNAARPAPASGDVPRGLRLAGWAGGVAVLGFACVRGWLEWRWAHG